MFLSKIHPPTEEFLFYHSAGLCSSSFVLGLTILKIEALNTAQKPEETYLVIIKGKYTFGYYSKQILTQKLTW